jgi:uncharacterized protein YbdZ (MbtH family)
MRVRKLKKQETRALTPIRGNGFPGFLAVGATAVFIAALMILATMGLAKTVESWGKAQVIESNDEHALSPQVAMDGEGNAIAVWNTWDGTLYSIWSNRYVVGEGWGLATPIETDDMSAEFPQVAMDGEGNAIAVWQQSDGSRFSIWSNRYVVGEGWGLAQPIETEIFGASSPQVAMDRDGNAIAVWEQADGTQWNIWSNRFAVGVGWGVAELVETNDGSAYHPQVATDGDGDAIAVWFQWDGSRFSIWSNRFRRRLGVSDAVGDRRLICIISTSSNGRGRQCHRGVAAIGQYLVEPICCRGWLG